MNKYNMTKDEIREGLKGGEGLFVERVGGDDDNPQYRLLSDKEIERNLVQLAKAQDKSKSEIHKLKIETRKWLRRVKKQHRS